MNDPRAGIGSFAPEAALFDWVRRKTGDVLLAQAAAVAARAERAGHACAWLPDEGFDQTQLDRLRDSSWVSANVTVAPFVLDEAGRFYVRRNAAAEEAVADALLARATSQAFPVGGSASILAELLPDDASSEQRVAIAGGIGRSLFVLTGGPGTGKTTSLLALLLATLRLRMLSGSSDATRIALAAPTGKAAARMAQALRERLGRLRTTLDSSWQPALKAAAALEATTLHRLLGYRLAGDALPIAADVVAVDEASMVDLGLMRTLLQSLRPDSLLILLGDPDQLASVEAGSVLADIIAAAPGTPLASCVSRLVQSHRAQAAFTRLLDAVRRGDVQSIRGAAEDRAGPLRLKTVPDARTLRGVLHAWLQRHEEVYRGLLKPGLQPRDAMALLRRVQILCALRHGAFGQIALNEAIEDWLRHQHAVRPVTWFPGRVVMITKNDRESGLSNGDIGVVLDNGSGPMVWFEDATDGAGAPRAFAPQLLPPSEAAWAITIHKAQGSEYESIAALLPPASDSLILSRELVYTALSRARHDADLWCTDAALDAALARPVRRAGGLRDRLLRRSQ